MDNTPQPVSRPLPGVGTIISDSWKLFTSTWNTSVKTSSLLIYVGLVYLATGLLAHLNSMFLPLTFLASLLGGLATAWITIRIILTMLKLEAGQQPMPAAEESKKAWSLFIPLLWVGFLTGLVVLGASLLFILPGIYFGVALYFSQFMLIDQGIRGTQALGASRALVKGRWWGTFGRLIVGGIVFGLIIGIAMAVVFGIMGAIAGPESFVGDSGENPLMFGVAQLLQMIVMAGLMPLISGFQVKMYRALQKTR